MLAPFTSEYQHTSDRAQVFVANSVIDAGVIADTTANGSIKGLDCNSKDQEEVAGAANLHYSKLLEAIINPMKRQSLTAIVVIKDLRLFLQAIAANIAVACSLEASSYAGSAGNTCYSVAEVGTQDGSMESDLANTIAIIATVVNFAHFMC